MTTFTPSGNGGYLLPSGYLSTQGSQIVDSAGDPVRIASVGWNQNFTNYAATVAAMKAAGFNTIRVSWVNATMTSDLARIDQIVAAATTYGMKVIIDNHTDEPGHDAADNYGSQQKNGLWYDLGGASDNTDGGGNAGTVTQASFLQDWVTVAQHYAGNSTVIGFDLRNEPLEIPGSSTWGTGNVNTDIRLMYEQVGDAIQAVNPGPLIIAEGPEDYSGSVTSSAAAPWGDLSDAAAAPVTLNVSNKVVYSVHDYPTEISAVAQDSGSGKVSAMNTTWGYLVSDNIAPVFVGEFGASMTSSYDAPWASTLVNYMNGLDGSSGGPTFSGTQQGVSGDWWVWGYLPGQSPDGTLNADGSLNAAQEAVWSQTLFKPVTTTPTPTPVPTPAPTPTPTPSTTASPSNTQVFAGSTAAIIDSSGNRWTITSGAQIAVNGTVDTTTANVIEIAYEQGVIWQENQSDLWWSKTSPSAAWAPPAGTSVSPIPATPTPTPAPTPAPTPGPTPTVTTSANDTQVAIGSTSAIIDSAGNQWTITSGGQIAVNGTVDATTGRVILLAYENSVIWQENADDLWWSKTSVSATWLPAGGTAVSPIPASDLAAVATITITPTNGTTQTISGNAVTTKTVASDTFTLTGNGAASIVLGSTSQTINFIQMSNVTVTGGAGSATLTASAGTYSITVGKGAMQVTAGAGVDSYVVKRGSGALTINDFSTAQGDTLTVASALQNAAKVASDGQGGSAITFGGAAGAVDLKGVSSFSLSTIHWA